MSVCEMQINIIETKAGKEAKAYLLIFSCSVSRAVHLELAPNSTTQEFLKYLKRLVAHRRRPSRVNAHNVEAFQAALKCH